MNHPFWGAVGPQHLGGEPTTRNDLPEMAELFVQRLPASASRINTTGLTPHRAIPMLTRIVEFCARATSWSASASRSTASATSTIRCGTSNTASTRRFRRSKRCRRWRRATPNFQFGLAGDNLQHQPRRRREHLAWARERDLDIVFNMLRFTDAMLNNKALEPAIKFREREEQLCGILPGPRARGVRPERPTFMYLHYADMIANGYQRRCRARSSARGFC